MTSGHFLSNSISFIIHCIPFGLFLRTKIDDGLFFIGILRFLTNGKQGLIHHRYFQIVNSFVELLKRNLLHHFAGIEPFEGGRRILIKVDIVHSIRLVIVSTQDQQHFFSYRVNTI